MDMQGGWNPMVDQEKVKPNSLQVGCNGKKRTAIITGPNAGGKSTIMKSAILAAIMAQSLGIAPATAFTFTPFSSIRAYLNIVDDTAGGNSLFMASVKRAFELLESAQKSGREKACSLTVFDEIFNGTSATEGEAAACALIQRLVVCPTNLLLVTTHFKKLTTLEGIDNYKVTVTTAHNGALQYPFALQEGVADQCVAFDILREQGFDAKFIEEATKNLRQIVQAKLSTPTDPSSEASQSTPDGSFAKSSEKLGSDPSPAVSVVLPAEVNSTQKPYGMKNLEQNCFMNAALQCCFRLKKINDALAASPHTSESMIQCYLNVLNHRNALAADQFRARAWKMINKKPGTQQDVDEFLVLLFNTMFKELGATRGENLRKFISTTLHSRLRAPHQGTKEIVLGEINDPAMILNVPIKENDKNLDSCLQRFFKEEHNVDYRLESGKDVKVSKKISLKDLPDYLCIYIKRTIGAAESEIRSATSLNQPLSFDLETDFNTYLHNTNEDSAYNLIGIICFQGLDGRGHYTSYVNCKQIWYHCDDSIITLSDVNSVAARGYGTTEECVPICFFFEKKCIKHT
jgi:ubiquitin C-terminal hydrolase